MELKQAGIFGEYYLVGKKKKSKKNDNKNVELKQKLQLLYDLYERLYEQQNIDPLEYRDIIIKGNIIVYPEERQAEPIDSIKLTTYDIDKRISIMQEAVK
jgi:hypothetical protein